MSSKSHLLGTRYERGESHLEKASLLFPWPTVNPIRDGLSDGLKKKKVSCYAAWVISALGRSSSHVDRKQMKVSGMHLGPGSPRLTSARGTGIPVAKQGEAVLTSARLFIFFLPWRLLSESDGR